MTTEEAIGSLESAVEEFAREFVGNPCCSSRFPTEGKIIHDPLWGTIRLEPYEVALLDLPLLQRLRQIRQTSLVGYVFPGCSHTRFEHTLGVLHQAARLAEAVNRVSGPGGGPFDHNTIVDLRLAALFHDCGHCCFSHISENIYQHCPDMAAATGDDGIVRSGHPHEVLSMLILKSKPVRDYIERVASHYREQLNVDRAAGWIVGRAEGNDNCNLYVSQVISGPFDADKLDYIFRDARYSGLPLTLDLERIWASCSVGTWQKDTKTLVLRRGSITPLEQVLFNKMNLFSVVYQHPKVRAVEAMFQGVIEYCKQHGLSIHGRRLSHASDYLWVTDDCFFSEALSRKKDHALHQMIHDILYRRHFVRALTISRETVEPDDGHKLGYDQLLRLNHRRNLGAYKERRRIARRIWEKAGRLGMPQQIWLDLPPNPPMGEADSVIVSVPGGRLVELASLFKLDYWSDQYMNYRWRGHVFCPPQYQREVHKAAKQVMNEEFGLQFNDLAKMLSHVPA